MSCGHAADVRGAQLDVLEQLARGPCTVTQLDDTGRHRSTVYAAIDRLRARGLVWSPAEGVWSITGSGLHRLWSSSRGVPSSRRPKIGPVQLDVMDSLESGALDISTLADHTGRTYDSIYAAIRGLVSRGLVRREKDQVWNAAYTLTPEGRVELLRALRDGRVPGVSRRSAGR